MGWLDWLFGEEEEESNPEFLVLGAKLKCVYGSTNSYLYVDTDNMNINNLPEACVSDSRALYNILPFGQCVMGGPCSAMMKIEEEWYNPKPQTKEVNGKEAITTDSTLICAATGMLIEAVSSGQDGVFANQLLLMQEMDVLYPGLRELLEDPYGSLYLKDGMYELGIQFLQDRMEANGGSIEIFAMDTQNSLEASYITAAFERLLPYVDTRASGRFFDGLQTVICKAGVENGADAHVLNADLIEVLQADCGDYAQKVSDGGYYKYQEENKMFLNWLGESSMSMAYGVMVYQSMVNWKPGSRNVYESNKGGDDVKEVESETNGGGGNNEGSLRTIEGGSEALGTEIPKAANLKNSQTVQNHMNDIIKKGQYKGELSRPYIDTNGTNLLLDEIMGAASPTKDTVLNNGLRWDVAGSFRGSEGTWELVVDLDTNTIVHFNFTH